MSTNLAIRVSGLTKTYVTSKMKKVYALKHLNLEVHQGEVFGFLGPNGAGKSTTIKTLMGLLKPTTGTAELFSVPVSLAGSRQRVGYLPENPSFYDFLTAREYLCFVGSGFGMSPDEIDHQSDRVLTLLDLQAAAKRPIRGYSKGMVQRLGLAQTLLHDPDLYILDEPMSGLDPIGRALVKDIILDLKKNGKTVFFSTHVTADVERVCDRIGVIVGGVYQDERIVSELLREGVDGYICRVKMKIVPDDYHASAVDCGGGITELFVSRQKFDNFTALVVAQEGSFELIEPRRRDVEDYFLSLVQHKKESV